MGTRIGDLIDRQIIALGITQGDVARRTGVSEAYLSVMKSGKKGASAPRPKTVKSLADALGVPSQEVWDALMGENAPKVVEQQTPPPAPTQEKPWKYSDELANNRHGKVHSRQRAFYIWENLACRDEELPGSFDSSVLQWQIEDYINGQYTDEELYNAAVQWCQECKKVTLEYYRNLLKQEEEERRRKKGGLAGK